MEQLARYKNDGTIKKTRYMNNVYQYSPSIEKTGNMSLSDGIPGQTLPSRFVGAPRDLAQSSPTMIQAEHGNQEHWWRQDHRYRCRQSQESSGTAVGFHPAHHSFQYLGMNAESGVTEAFQLKMPGMVSVRLRDCGCWESRYWRIGYY